MTYCNSSLYRNSSCGYGRNTGAGCVCDNNGNCSCSNGVGGCNTGSCGNGCNSNCGGSCVGGIGTNRPSCNFPPRPSVYGTCPPGTFPCPCRPYYPYSCGCSGDCNGSGVGGCNTGNCGNNSCGCGNNNGCGCQGSSQPGAFAFLNSSGTTLTTGSIIPLRYVLGTGNLAKNTTGGSIALECGTYSASYSVSGVTPDAGTTITITPEYGGMLHPEYARSFTSSAADQSFEISGLLGITVPSDTTLSLNVTTTGDATADATVTGANASMILTKLCGCNN